MPHGDVRKIARQEESLVLFDTRHVLDDSNAERAARICIKREPEVISNQIFKGINSADVSACRRLVDSLRELLPGAPNAA